MQFCLDTLNFLYAQLINLQAPQIENILTQNTSMHSPYYIAQQRRDHYDDPFIDFVPQQLDKKRHMLSFWWNKRRKRHHFKALKVKGPGLNQEYEYAVSMLVLYKGTVQNLVECFCKAMFCNYKFQFCPHIFVFIFLKTCKRIHKNVLYFYQQLYQ